MIFDGEPIFAMFCKLLIEGSELHLLFSWFPEQKFAQFFFYRAALLVYMQDKYFSTIVYFSATWYEMDSLTYVTRYARASETIFPKKWIPLGLKLNFTFL